MSALQELQEEEGVRNAERGIFRESIDYFGVLSVYELNEGVVLLVDVD